MARSWGSFTKVNVPALCLSSLVPRVLGSIVRGRRTAGRLLLLLLLLHRLHRLHRLLHRLLLRRLLLLCARLGFSSLVRRITAPKRAVNRRHDFVGAERKAHSVA